MTVIEVVVEERNFCAEEFVTTITMRQKADITLKILTLIEVGLRILFPTLSTHEVSNQTLIPIQPRLLPTTLLSLSLSLLLLLHLRHRKSRISIHRGLRRRAGRRRNRE